VAEVITMDGVEVIIMDGVIIAIGERSLSNVDILEEAAAVWRLFHGPRQSGKQAARASPGGPPLLRKASQACPYREWSQKNRKDSKENNKGGL
jgi:hypothetical protein